MAKYKLHNQCGKDVGEGSYNLPDGREAPTEGVLADKITTLQIQF
jgi:hypothetical protein